MGDLVMRATYPLRKSYDSENRQVSLRTTRDNGATWDETAWTYDDLTGLLLAKTYADGSQMTYTYTPDGLPSRTTYPGGKWKELVYDDTRAVTNILHTARSTPNTSFLHDAFGNVTNAVDTAGNSWLFSYASINTLTNEVFTSPRLCDSACQTNALARLVDTYSRSIGYDLTIGSTPCSSVRYSYDAEGRIATLAATNAANRGFQVSYINEAGYNYGYTLTTPNGAILTRTVTRDPYRRSLTLDCTTRFNNVEVATFAYTFDAGNRPVTRNNDRFAYNDRDEITSALIGTNNINRAYDTIGNHVFCAFNSATNFNANNQLNQTTASYRCAPTSVSGDATPQDEVTLPLFDGYDILSTNKFTWSAQGGLLRDGRFVFAFDAEDQLISVTSSHLTNGAIRVVNAYDYRHRRISKAVYRCVVNTVQVPAGSPPSPASTTMWNVEERHDFVYDDWNLIHETVTSIDANSTTNVTEVEYFWGPDLSNTLQGAGGVGGLLAVSRNGQFYFPVYDNLGNIVKYLDESGTIVAAYDYDDFGQMLSSYGSMPDYFAIRFSTKYFDAESGLYCYSYRFYSPLLRIWLNRDPIGEEGGVNLTSFCGNVPMRGIDCLGLTVVYDDKIFPGAVDFDVFYELAANASWWSPYNRSFAYPEGTLPMKNVISPKQFPWWRWFDDDADVVIRLKRETNEDFEKIMKKAFCYACSRVALHDLFWDKYLDEMIFDTSYQKNWDHYFLIEGEKNVWRGNEINYAGIAIYEAVAGMSKSPTFVYAWKWIHGYEISAGTLYWYEKGLKLFEKYKKMPDLCTPKEKKGNGK